MYLLQEVNRRSDIWCSEIICASIMVLLSNMRQSNVRQQKTAGKTRQNPAAYGRLKNEFVKRHEQLALIWLTAGESP
ncbi:hypothetical protein ACTVPT_09270 [Serratia bockelmannii]|uniref:hypothetical protein n=1 Tax=Serratia TaxID=613 RepID=UPI002183047C|nr:Uncharacterised protein [Serratia marcescens]